MKLNRNVIIYALLALGLLWIAVSILQRDAPAETVQYSQFLQLVDEGSVRSATINERDQVIEGTLADGSRYSVTFLTDSGDTVVERLAARGVPTEVDAQRTSLWVGMLTNILPLVLIFAFIFFLLNQMQGGGSKMMSFGRSKAKLVSKEMPKVTFADVAGLDEAVEEIREIKEYLASPAKFQKMGAKIPKGVLLFGPPGTGKTLLARAVAGEAGVPFFSISGSDFVEMFVGVGAARVRDLFEQAKTSAPSIVFVDEIDAVGRQRGAGLGGGHDEREQTLNQMLVEMDGFDVRTGVVLIAATNRPDILDPALLRPGRFDRQIVVDRPDLPGRHDILKVHASDKPLDPDIDLEVIARRTPGFTGADLANVINEGALLAARRGHENVTLAHLEEAIDRVMAGPERRSRLITPEERRIIAYHEAGHALVSHMLPHAHPVHKVTIIPRGRALGFTLMLPTEDRYLVTKGELADELAVMLGGRAAEEVVFGDVTTGAQDDIERSTKVARQMVCQWGMSSLGPMALGHSDDTVFLGRDFAGHPDYSDNVAAEIDAEVRKMITHAFERAQEVLTEYRELLDTMANRLMEEETLEAAQLDAILQGQPKVRAERGRMREPAAATAPEDSEKEASQRRRGLSPNPRPGLSPA